MFTDEKTGERIATIPAPVDPKPAWNGSAT